ncbi:MAG TPA: class I SAM-dependent methyltransferase [Gemmataceae bacterium]|nr:class I SAM-dependent methyltransferase [Gemmataceae bacterium]
MSTSPERRRSGVNAVLESREPARRSFLDYRGFIKNHYDGLPGALTKVTGLVTGHEALAGRLIRPKAFDVRGSKRILDAGCGNGRYSKFILRWADPNAVITAFDLSPKMLERAKKRLKSDRVGHVQADLTRLPFNDRAFDAVVCGWVIEHLPDPRPGLRELARVLEPGGKLLLMATEDTFTGAMCSRLWHCRTYNREALRQACAECHFTWQREHWFSRLHARLHLGGILVELQRV